MFSVDIASVGTSIGTLLVGIGTLIGVVKTHKKVETVKQEVQTSNGSTLGEKVEQIVEILPTEPLLPSVLDAVGASPQEPAQTPPEQNPKG